jgi:beta-lactam-binding protein with PASTA domain
MVRPNANHESKRKKTLLIGLVIGILVFIFIVLPAVALTGVWISVRQERARRTPQVKVPDVVGQDYRRGEAMLKEKGLGMEVLAKRSDQNQPVDIILFQVPQGGESVDLGYNVGVTIGGLSAERTPLPQR